MDQRWRVPLGWQIQRRHRSALSEESRHRPKSDLGTEQQLTLFPLPAPRALSMEDLHALFALADWRPLLFLRRGDEAKWSSLALMKAHVLPYLIRIPSEAELARQLAERADLRSFCGFTKSTPTRAVLWHFRRTANPEFGRLMVHSLCSIAAAAASLNTAVPFATSLPNPSESLGDPNVRIQLTSGSISIDLWPVSRWPSSDQGTLHDLLVVRDPNAWPIRLRPDSGLGVLGLPLIASFGHYELGSNRLNFFLYKPTWLEAIDGFSFYGTDSLAGQLPSHQTTYNACNVIVPRTDRDGRTQILLAQRRGGTGNGYFTIPGGKQKPGETLRECASRELYEETGLRLLESTPVSVRTNLSVGGFQPRRVWSIGVLASRYTGTPRSKEKQVSDWKWYSLDSLPGPLFEPAKAVISDYILKRFSKIDWEVLDADLGNPRNGVSKSNHVTQLPLALESEI